MKKIVTAKEIKKTTIPDYIKTASENIQGLVCPYCSNEFPILRDNFDEDNQRFSKCPDCKRNIHISYTLKLEQTLEIKIQRVTLEEEQPQSIQYITQE